MAKKNNTNEELERGKKLIREAAAESGNLYKALVGIGEAIKVSIDNAIEGSQDMDNVAKNIAETYRRDIVSSIRSSAKSMEKHVDLQMKMNKGQNISKDINAALERIEIKRAVLNERIESASDQIKETLEDEKEELDQVLKAEEERLKKLKDTNTENQKSKGLGSLLLDNAKKYADQIDKTGTLTEILEGNWEEVVTVQRMGQLSAISLFSFIAKGMAEVSKQQTAFRKELGLSESKALALRQRMADVAAETGNTAINSMDTNKTMVELNATLGTASTVIRNDIVGEMAKLGKLTGMSAEAQANFAMFAQKSGIHASEVTRQTRAAVVATEEEYGVRLNVNKVMDEAGKISGIIRANLGYNITAIAGAVAKAKQFGMTLQDLAGISSNLLNFQSSIEAELTAELFTGKQLRLEKARLYALTGDYESLTEEIKANAGGELEFARMNVLQKEKLAAALGMSADQMADMVYNQANLAELAQQARDVGDEELAKSLEARDIQQQFNDLIVKLQTSMVDLVDGPLGGLLEGLGAILGSAETLKTLFIAMSAIKMTQLVSSMISLGAALGFSSVGAAWTIGIATAGIGLLVALPIITGMLSKMDASKNKSSQPPKIRSYANLGAEEMVTLEKGSAIFDQGESVVRTENFGRMNDILERIDKSINNQKLSFNVETHHNTRYR
jgi:hypothetical protein